MMTFEERAFICPGCHRGDDPVPAPQPRTPHAWGPDLAQMRESGHSKSHKLHQGKPFDPNVSGGALANLLVIEAIPKHTLASFLDPFRCCWCASVSFSTKYLLCQGCRNQCYCSRKCQRAAWKMGGHKSSCPSQEERISMLCQKNASIDAHSITTRGGLARAALELTKQRVPEARLVLACAMFGACAAFSVMELSAAFELLFQCSICPNDLTALHTLCCHPLNAQHPDAASITNNIREEMLLYSSQSQ